MHTRVLDLDGSLLQQGELLRRHQPVILPLQHWGPCIRMGCRFGRFRQFEEHLAGCCGKWEDQPGQLTWYGSGDFHHVSLALVRRQQTRPINLLILDNHPDWMRGIPVLHCGTWLYHASRLPQVHRIFHLGGDVDFDNHYRWLAPWKPLRSGKIIVFPAWRKFTRGPWSTVPSQPLREAHAHLLRQERLESLLEPFRAELAARPLYISLDKDVMREHDAVVNWDSGHLVLLEVQTILDSFVRAAGGRIAGMDVVGDWSPVRTQGWLRHWLHATEHPGLIVSASRAARRNERTNISLFNTIRGTMSSSHGLAS
jgi:hypothetical protein